MKCLSLTSQIINIAVLGVAKTGKTTFINFLTKDFNKTNKPDREITTKRKIEPSEQEENKFTKYCVFETNSIERFHAITKGREYKRFYIFFILVFHPFFSFWLDAKIGFDLGQRKISHIVKGCKFFNYFKLNYTVSLKMFFFDSRLRKAG